MPNRPERHKVHQYVRNNVECRRRNVQSEQLQTVAGSFRNPDLNARRAEDEWDDKINPIEDGVHYIETLEDPVEWIPLDRTEDTEDQQQNGYFRKAYCWAVNHICSIVELESFNSFPQMDIGSISDLVLLSHVSACKVPLVDAAFTIIHDCEYLRNPSSEEELNCIGKNVRVSDDLLFMLTKARQHVSVELVSKKHSKCNSQNAQSSHLHFLTITILVYIRRAKRLPVRPRLRAAVTVQYGLIVNGSSKSGITPGGGARATSEGATTVYVWDIATIRLHRSSFGERVLAPVADAWYGHAE